MILTPETQSIRCQEADMNPINHLADPMLGTSRQINHLNADYANHLKQAALQRQNVPLFLRLVPQVLRRPIEAYLSARRIEKQMITLWETSPHLLQDAGIVLTRATDLPPQLIPAPKRVLDHVAAIDPQQIVEAELKYPPKKAISATNASGAALAVFGKRQNA